MRALEKDPDARFATAMDFALALAACTLAGKWTYGDAALVARNSSRPPPPGGTESLPNMRAPRVPSISGASGAVPSITGASGAVDTAGAKGRLSAVPIH